MTVGQLERQQFAALAQALDPARVLQAMGRAPDPWQAETLRSDSKRIALLAARQVGKTEVEVALGLHTAACSPGSVVAIVTPTLRQSAKLLRRIRRALPATPHVTATNTGMTLLTLSNDSEVHAWPDAADNVRGDTLDLLIVDESAFVSDETIQATLPMLGVSGGRLVMATTPGGPSGFAFDIHRAGADSELGMEWDRRTIRASECPRYSAESLASLRRALGERAYAVEFECEWREGANAAFTTEELARMLGTDWVPDVLDGEAPLPDDYDPLESFHVDLHLPPL